MMRKSHKNNGWIHSFAVIDTQTHKNGYTIYKITSIVFPRAIPEALTCITVWKRFHDIKRLHREMSRRQKSLKIPGDMPVPTDSTYFKRFDTEVIERRKEFIIKFLDFVAQHPALYKCHIFFQFFNETSSFNESPLHKLHIESYSGNVPGRLEENNYSKTEKKTDSNLVYITSNIPEQKRNKQYRHDDDNSSEKENVDANLPVTVANIEGLQSENIEVEKPARDYTRMLTPMASIESEDSDYIYEAALEFSRAVQAEANLEYNEAHLRYKRGVELLLNGSKDDSNEERRYIAKTKITKYLARSDDIFQKFLCGDNNDATDSRESSNSISKLTVQLSIEGQALEDIHSSYYIERPLNQLAKYKVLKILGQSEKSVIQVRCITDRVRPTYVIKGIEKPSSNAPTQTIFLPQHVPYMVDLLAFFQSDQKIYLLLRYAEAGRLLDYMQNYELKAEKHSNFEVIFSEVDRNVDSKKENEQIIDAPTEATEHTEFVKSSQRLLESVSSTLNEVENKLEEPKMTIEENVDKSTKLNRLPEASVKQWARELFVAIDSLHQKGVTLIDLHIHNLLLGDKGQLLLTYFYQNQTLNEESYSLFAHSEHCVAPERPLTFKSDWWSYGVVLYQMLIGVSFKTMHPGRIDIYGYIQYPESVEISDSGRDLLNNLLTKTPEERYDADQIRTHDFFKGTNWDEVRQNGLNNSSAKISCRQ